MGVHSHSWFHYGWAQQGPIGFLMFPVLQAYQFECEEGKWYTAQGEVEKCAAQGHGFMSSALGLMLSGSLLHLVVQSLSWVWNQPVPWGFQPYPKFSREIWAPSRNMCFRLAHVTDAQPPARWPHVSSRCVFSLILIVEMVDGYLVLVKTCSPHQMDLLRLKLISPICGPLDAPVT